MVVLFLLLTINNTIWGAIWGTLAIWILIAFIYILFIFNEEYYKPRIIFKRLKSGRYDFLIENGFELFDNIILKGTYKCYEVHIYMMTKIEQKKKNVQYDVIQSFYIIKDCEDIEKRESSLNGIYRIGELLFKSNTVGFIPKQWENPNFKDILDDLISILNREGLEPMVKADVEILIGVTNVNK